MKNWILTLILVAGASLANAQLKQKVADGHFALMEYAECVDMYDELAKKCTTGHKKADWDNVRKAAEAHYYLFEMEQAADYYELLQNKNKLIEADRVLYIHALRYAEKYGRSNEVVRESAHLFPKNSFFARRNASIDQFNMLFADSAFYRVHAAEINSGKGDFGAAYFNNSIVFASKARNTGFVNRSYGWDGDYYLNVMQSNFGADSVLQDPTMLKHQFISKAHDGPVSFSSDGKEMVITKNKLGKKNGKQVIVLSLYFSKMENGEWSDLTPFEFNNEAYNVGHGVFNAAGDKLYFVSDKDGGFGLSDIYVSERLGNGWSAPTNLGAEINTDQHEMFPFVQEGMLYFASKGHHGLGGLDIFEVPLDSKSKPHNIGYPLNTAHDDFGLIYDQSGVIGYLSSNRGDNVDRLYHVKKRTFNLQLDGIVYEKYADKEALANQTVWIKNRTTQELDSIVTDDKGKFNKSLRINQDYQIYTKKHEFILLKEATASTQGIQRDSTLRCELVLKPTTILVHLRVIEKKSRAIIPMATTTITDYNLGWDTTLITNDEGLVTLTVERNKVLWAHGAKKGFIDADVSFNTTNQNDRVIDLELELPLIKKGEKFKLENIFYDLNKSTLRSESMASLDKLADFIVKNDLKIELSAHTDSRGSASYNQRLSQARAQSCVDYLIKKGVSKSRILAKGYGEKQLVNKCKDGVQCSEEEHQDNRRTEVKILEVR